jgi:hypothetical protein
MIQKKYPVIVQTRKILDGENKGMIKKVLVWCKYIEEVTKYNKLRKVTRVDSPSYEVINTEIQIRNGPDFEKTFEQEEGAY